MSGLQKFIITALALAIAGGIYFVFTTYGGTQFNITLTTNTSLDEGLIAHWTFDGTKIGTASSTGGSGTTTPEITFVDSSSNKLTPAGTSFTIAKPTGTNNGDLILAFVAGDGSGFYLPSGFATATAISGTSHTSYLGYKVAGVSEPGTYTFNVVSGTELGRAIMWTVSGQASSNFIATTSSTRTTTNTTGDFTSITTTVASSTIYGIVSTEAGDRSYSSSQPASAYTLVEDNPFPAGSSNTANVSLFVLERDAVTTGTYTGSTTITGTATDIEAAQVAIYPDTGSSADCAATTGVYERRESGNNGRFCGGHVKVPGAIGTGVYLDGDDDYIQGLMDTGVKSVSFWVKMPDNTSQKLINMDGTDQIETNGSDAVVATSWPNATVYVNASSGSATLSEDNTWYHVVVTDSTGVDGSAFEVGRVGSTYAEMSVDDIRVFDTVLTAEKVQRLYDLGATTHIATTITTNSDLEDGLVHHWPFDIAGASTSTVYDRIGSVNGTITATTTTTGGGSGTTSATTTYSSGSGTWTLPPAAPHPWLYA